MNRITAFLNSNAAHLLLSCLGGFLCFNIFFRTGVTSSGLDGDTILRHAILTGLYSKGSSLVCLALLCLLATDQLLDAVLYIAGQETLKKREACKKAWKTIQNGPERVVFLIGMALPSICLFLPNPDSIQNIALIVHACNRAQLILVGGSVYASNCRQDPCFSPHFMTLTMYLLFIVGNSFASHAANEPSRRFSPYYILTVVFCYSSVIIFVLATLRKFFQYTYYIITIIGKSCQQAPNSDPSLAETNPSSQTIPIPIQPRPDEKEEYVYRFPFVLTILFWIALKIWAEQLPPWGELNDYDLFILNVPDVVFLFMLSVFTMRVVKYEAVEYMAALGVEKQYVRCITHELNTQSTLSVNVTTNDEKIDFDQRDCAEGEPADLPQVSTAARLQGHVSTGDKFESNHESSMRSIRGRFAGRLVRSDHRSTASHYTGQHTTVSRVSALTDGAGAGEEEHQERYMGLLGRVARGQGPSKTAGYVITEADEGESKDSQPTHKGSAIYVEDIRFTASHYTGPLSVRSDHRSTASHYTGQHTTVSRVSALTDGAGAGEEEHQERYMGLLGRVARGQGPSKTAGYVITEADEGESKDSQPTLVLHKDSRCLPTRAPNEPASWAAIVQELECESRR